MGRVMSLLITGSVGLVPVSMFLSGFAVQLDVDATLLGAGIGMAVVAIAAVSSAAVRNIGLEPLAEEPALEPAVTAGGSAEANGDPETETRTAAVTPA
jgi:hypothetical protein